LRKERHLQSSIRVTAAILIPHFLYILYLLYFLFHPA
jgi:hypothetical protein